ncbi:MAG: hypothetical protein II137_06885, partial [Anaerovibrio sp.]|nr:hypothetical protein [Anaerovibrio sp.]
MTGFSSRKLKCAVIAGMASMVLMGGTVSANEAYDAKILADQQNVAQMDADQNKQLSKQAFARQKVDTETFSGYFMQDKLSDYQVFAGTIIPGIMITGLNSDLPGNIIGQVSENVYDTTTGQYLLIPQGTKIIGKYDSQTTFGQKRALVVWNRL